MPYTHFKMETVNSILTMITPNCFMAKLDVKDAYYSASLAYLHKNLINITAYIDDLFTCSPTYVKCEQNIKCSINLLESLGFITHPEKSLFVPKRCIEYLDFILNSQSMTISLSDIKKEKIKLLCSEILEDGCSKIRTIAELLEKFTSSLPAV